MSAADLKDDAFGRALDILCDIDLDALYPKLALKTVNQLKVMDHFDDLLPVHSDTTSLSLYGESAQRNDASLCGSLRHVASLCLGEFNVVCSEVGAESTCTVDDLECPKSYLRSFEA